MTGNMQAFNMQDVQARVTESIRSSFASFIPDEMWDAMIKRETESFMRDELPKMVRAALVKHGQDEIARELSKPEYLQAVSGEPSQEVKEIIRQLAPDLVSALFGNVVQHSTNIVRQQINNSPNSGFRY